MPRAEEIKTHSLTCQGLASGMLVAGQLAATYRGIIRDLLAELVWRLLKKATVAAATAPYTGGGSIAALASDIAIDAAKTANDIAGEPSKVATHLSELSGKLGKLADGVGGPVRTAVVSNALPSFTKTVDTVVAAQDPTQADQAKSRYEAALPDVPKTPARPWYTSGTLDE
jgi:hypothetical protein